MKKRTIFSLIFDPESSLMISTIILLIPLVLTLGGCGKKIYTPPDKEVKSEIILINDIYDPGFYVELDDKEAGFLKDTLEIRVTPGKYKLKIFNTETAFAEKEETTVHTFNLKVEVNEGEVKKIMLTWDEKGYYKEVRKGSKSLLREEAKREKKEKKRETLPGVPY